VLVELMLMVLAGVVMLLVLVVVLVLAVLGVSGLASCLIASNSLSLSEQATPMTLS